MERLKGIVAPRLFFFFWSSLPFALYFCNQGKKDHGGHRKFKLTLPVPLLQIPVLSWKERGCTTETPGGAYHRNLVKSETIYKSLEVRRERKAGLPLCWAQKWSGNSYNVDNRNPLHLYHRAVFKRVSKPRQSRSDLHTATRLLVSSFCWSVD